MLVYMEIPGLYVQIDTGLVYAIDHIETSVVENTPLHLAVRVTNPTAFPAKVKVLAENSKDTAHPLGQNALIGCQRIVLDPHQEIVITFKKD
jgi:hypothetical protein